MLRDPSWLGPVHVPESVSVPPTRYGHTIAAGTASSVDVSFAAAGRRFVVDGCTPSVLREWAGNTVPPTLLPPMSVRMHASVRPFRSSLAVSG